MTTATATLDQDTTDLSATTVAAPRISKRALAGLVALVITAGGAGYAFTTRGHVSTDDAQVDADIVAVQSEAGGTVAEVLFSENERVTSGQLLVRLNDTEARARLDEAKANLAAAEAAAAAADSDVAVVETRATGDLSLASATLRTAAAGVASSNDGIVEANAALVRAQASAAQAESDLARMTTLHADGSIADSTYEQVETAARVARANVDAAGARVASLHSGVQQARGQVAQANARLHTASAVDVLIAQSRARAQQAHAQVDVARARVELAQVAFDDTRIVAPADGFISRRNVQVGQMVQPGHGVVQLVRDSRWVTANFKETQIENMHPGQAVRVAVDAYPDAEIWASVESMSGATGSRFTLLPPDNASGNFTKVVQRVPVRLRIGHLPEGVTLLPGMNVDVTVHTRSHS